MTWRCSLASASNVKENENVSLLWAADYFGRPSFLLTICNLPPNFEWQILQIGIFAKFNSEKLLKMNIFVQNCLFLQHFPYY
nr:MAG TPA: hypothetical protein [Caudoviricetes sp.]